MLVEISPKNFDVILDLRYATSNNVCGHALYSRPICYLHEAMIPGLQQTIKSAKNLGLKLKIFDGFRPIEVQQYLYDKFPGDFISNPQTGAIPHCRGVAIDLTLTDLKGRELDMGSDFDEFSDLAFHNCKKISVEAQRNRLLLLGLMTGAGFDFYSKEWWHYQLFKPREYEVMKLRIPNS
ncbi:MAG: D-alanyl-D-alanine dipeptidase [Alphaproteobacteria bacterium]|nr:D-alanyl-D-alanine dipeptidase [Alphaproteobacteria bacterium]